jgi:N-acetylglutamate synthase-like GNAT family acetyltransferase|tara:strand:+ start:359 stop:1234 length:876 start_codon:yes stop_codon:yes gene_type:complete
MFNNTVLPNLSVRPPWQDELQRVSDLVSGLKASGISWNLHALVADAPERIVGLAGLRKDGDRGYVHFKVRPRYLNEGGGRLLLDAVMKQARALEIGRLSIQVNTDTGVDAFLQGAGFEVERAEELWQVDLLKVHQRMERISKRWKPSSDWIVRAVETSDLPAIAELIAPYERLSPDRLKLRQEGEPYGHGYEGVASSVVESDGQLMGVLLCQGTSGLNGYIEFRVVAQEYRKYSGVLGGLMLHRSVNEALKMDYGTVLFSVNLAQDFETRNLASRMEGVLVRSLRMLSLKV